MVGSLKINKEINPKQKDYEESQITKKSKEKVYRFNRKI